MSLQRLIRRAERALVSQKKKILELGHPEQPSAECEIFLLIMKGSSKFRIP